MWDSLRTRLTIIFVSLAIVPLLIFGIFSTTNNTAIGIQHALELQHEVANRVSSELQKFFQDDESNLILLTNDLRAIENPSRAQLIAILIEAINTGEFANTYSEFALLDSDGNEQVRLSRSEIFVNDQLQSRAGEPEFEQPHDNGEIYYSPLQYDAVADEYFLTIAVPFSEFRSIELQGVLVANIRALTLDQLLTNMDVNPDQSIYLADSDGQVVASQRRINVDRDTKITIPEKEGTYDGLTGNNVLYATQALQLGDHQFSVVAERHVSEALENVQQNLILGVVLMIATLLVVGVLAILFVRRFVQPIERLADVAKTLGGGDLTVRAKVTSKDEIGQLATAFNDMASTMEANTTRLRDARDEAVMAQKLAAENSRLKSEFLATMSHELRTPLNAIEGFTSIMLGGMGIELSPRAEDMVTRISSNSKRLLHLINDFLDLSRIESGRLELVHSPLSPRRLVTRWQNQMSVLAEEKGIEFVVNIREDLPEQLLGDEDALSKIVINLLGNAFKFTTEGQVTLDLSVEGANWLIAVSDTGIGIPTHAHEYIFDEFRQVDGSSKRLYGGTGLGLSLVQKLSRAMGGNVALTSEVGVGSTFTVTLPLDVVEQNEEGVA